ncbi:MAG: OmpA family protein [Paracoccaceae bacterium]
MKRTGTIVCAAISLCVVAPAGLAQAITLDMPSPAAIGAVRSERLTSYLLPTGPYAAGQLPARVVEGAQQVTAWHVEASGLSTLEMLSPLRAQLLGLGFKTVFECATVQCGGFDFRYGTTVLPEPDMHVDLGDFRFFGAERGTEVVSLIVSKTATTGFVQMIHVGDDITQPPILTTSTKTEPVQAPLQAGSTRTPPSERIAADLATLGDQLLSGGSVVLDDLIFASGTSTLAPGDYPSLGSLASWLAQNTKLTVALVGHTDASGGLEGNIALSRKRAEAVRQYLIKVHAIPAKQLEAQGVGYLAPRASNLTAEGREKNRRVEVMVTSTLIAP